MKTRINRLTAGIVSAMLTVSAAHAATFTAVDTYDEQTTNLYTITGEASGNNITAAAFSTAVSDAFTAGAGGVLNFDNADLPGQSTSFAVTFGGGSQTLNITSDNTHSTAANGDAVGVTGLSGLQHLGAGGSYTLTFDIPLTAFALSAVSRSTTQPDVTMTVNLDDGTTVNLGTETITSTVVSGNFDPGEAENWTPTNIFFGYQGSAANPIVSVSVTQSTFSRYDDLGFVTVVPEPASGAVVLTALVMMLIPRRGSTRID